MSIISISKHSEKHKKPVRNTEIGYYLAGLVEGDGYIGKRGIEILFSEPDLSNAYYIKKWVGYGTISKVKDKKAYKLRIFNRNGLEKVWRLINGKFQGPYKIQQAQKHFYDIKFNQPILGIDNAHNIMKTYWLSGFADADGNFSIFISNSKTHKTGKNITIPFRITQKNSDLLEKVKQVIIGGIIMKNMNKAGNIEHRYSTVNFKTAINVTLYFDIFHLQNPKQYQRYQYWKKIFVILQNKEHLDEEGLKKALFMKTQINKLILKFILGSSETTRQSSFS